jgi:hypothetical protein
MGIRDMSRRDAAPEPPETPDPKPPRRKRAK